MRAATAALLGAGQGQLMADPESLQSSLSCAELPLVRPAKSFGIGGSTD